MTEELPFLLQYLQPQHHVLEYGSGYSTSKIAAKCKTLVSIEHNEQWYQRIIKLNILNVQIIYTPQSKPMQPYDDGNLEQFKQYIISPSLYGPYDIIFIDGRARYECAYFAYKYLSHTDTLFFIHDFSLDSHILQQEHRDNYINVLKFFTIVKSHQRMYLFKAK